MFSHHILKPERAVLEVRRILLEHLRSVQPQGVIPAALGRPQ